LKRKIIIHSQPFLDSKEFLYLKKALKENCLCCGKYVQIFEQKFAQFLGRDVVCVNSGTSALHLTLLAISKRKKRKILIPTFTCSALLNASFYVGLQPVICDVNLYDFSLDIEDVKRKIAHDVNCLILVHPFGIPVDVKPFLELDVPVVEDCAHTLGAYIKNKMVGTLTQVSIFSFYATKFLTTSQGGAISSSDKKILNQVRDLREYDKKNNYKIRFNYKMSDLDACIGLAQLEKLEEFIKKRKNLASLYTQEFEKIKNIEIPRVYYERDCLYYRYIIFLKKGKVSSFIKIMHERGIRVERPVFKPLHRYFKLKGFNSAEKIYNKSVSIPIYPALTLKDAKYIITQIKKVLS